MKISPLSVLKAGIPNYILHLLRAFAELNDDNEYLLYTNRIIPFDLHLPERFKVIHLTRPSPHLQLWYQIGLPAEMKRDRIDLFHDPVYPLPFHLPVPGVVTVHDLSNYTHPEVHKFRSAVSGRLLPIYLRKARQIIAVSHFTALELRRLFPWTEEKITVILQGVSSRFKPEACPDILESVRRKYNLPERFFLFLGTLEPRKNLQRLLEAFTASISEIPLSMVITGGLGWKYEKILDAVSHHPCSDKIHLTGFVEDDDLTVLLSLADFLVYPSTLEGFGFPILEAMACGTPVITSNVSSMPEIAGDAALLVDPYSVVSISEGIAELGGNALFRKELSEKGIRRARCFSWKQTALKTLEVYRKVMDG